MRQGFHLVLIQSRDCEKGTKTSNNITLGDKSQITVVGCVSAAGHCIPPVIIWDCKTLHADMTKGELPGTIYGLSSKIGWIKNFLRYGLNIIFFVMLLLFVQFFL